MVDERQWSTAYAAQARADMSAYMQLSTDRAIHECHRLLLLQMACEKLCKAYLIDMGTSAYSLQSSHGYIARPLPILVKNEMSNWTRLSQKRIPLLNLCRHIAREIELLNPSVTRDGQRMDNCEYPWENLSGEVNSPLSWSFTVTRLLRSGDGRLLLKILNLAIERLIARKQL